MAATETTSEKLASIAKGAGIAAIGAGLAYLAAHLSGVDLGTYGPALAALCAAGFNVLRKAFPNIFSLIGLSLLVGCLMLAGCTPADCPDDCCPCPDQCDVDGCPSVDSVELLFATPDALLLSLQGDGQERGLFFVALDEKARKQLHDVFCHEPEGDHGAPAGEVPARLSSPSFTLTALQAAVEDLPNCWRDGPLPANTWHWGGVTLERDGNIYFADFKGDHVLILELRTAKRLRGGEPSYAWVRKEPHEIATWNNCLTWPPRPER